MATPEQKMASQKIMDAVTALNIALQNASRENLFVELRTVSVINERSPHYVVEKIETRETVLP